MRTLNSNLVSGLIIFCLAAFFVIESLRMQKFGELYISPGFFPLVIGSLFMLCSIQLIFQGIRSLKKDQTDHLEAESAGIDRDVWIRTIVIVAAMIVYVALLSARLPYYIITTAFLLCTLLYFHRGKKIQNVILSCVVSVGMYLLFTKVFLIPLP